MKKTIHNVETGEIYEVELTTEEIAQVKTDKKLAEKIETETKTNQSAKSALLERLGLTEDEAKLLLS
jgi:hypothetical protein